MPTKPDTRPVCPIPPDAKVGDIVVTQDGNRFPINSVGSKRTGVSVIGLRPAGFNWDGRSWDCDLYCIAFEYADGRKPNLPCTGKPKRTQAQRDGVWLRKFVRKRYMPAHETERMLAIADRLEKQA